MKVFDPVSDFAVYIIYYLDGFDSKFTIIDSFEQQFCNLNRPPDSLYSRSDTVIVTFSKNLDIPYPFYTVGFWIQYFVEEYSFEHLIDLQANASTCMYFLEFSTYNFYALIRIFHTKK